MRRILFFHQGRIADWAGAVFVGLGRQFPDTEILRFDLHQLIKQRPALLIKNLVAMAGRYAWDLVRQKRDFDDAFFTTPYLFKQVRKLSLEIHRMHPADFSFQMHSMHDHSSPQIPHFVYTDFTYENCKEFPTYGRYPWAPLRPDWLITLEREIYERATCTFAQSQYVTSTLVNTYSISAEKALNVCYGPNVDQHLLTNIPITPERYQSKRIIFIGGEWDRKGGPELVEAVAKVQQVHPDARLLIVGCTPNVSMPGVEVLGKVTPNELATHYAHASVFCMPSKLEPSAAVYVEAMHAGLPVVALRLGAVNEIITDGYSGYLVAPGDVEHLATVLTGLLGKPEACCRLGANGRSVVKKDYIWDRVFERVGNRIRECVMKR